MNCKYCNNNVMLDWSMSYCDNCHVFYTHQMVKFRYNRFTIVVDYSDNTTLVLDEIECHAECLLKLDFALDIKPNEVRDFIENKLKTYMVFS